MKKKKGEEKDKEFPRDPETMWINEMVLLFWEHAFALELWEFEVPLCVADPAYTICEKR